MMDNLKLLQRIHSGVKDFYDEDDRAACHITLLRSWIDSESVDDLAYVFDPDDDQFYDRLYTILTHTIKRVIITNKRVY